MNRIVTTNSDEGQQIINFLIKKLGIPNNAVSFTVRIELGSPITVENCKFFVETQDKTE